MLKSSWLKTLAVAIAVVSAVPANAHHSFAAFDTDRIETAEGTVKKFDWANPHTWLDIVVIDAAGVQTNLALEMASPVVLTRFGWKRMSYKAGDKVTVAYYPGRDNRADGMLLSAMDGTGSRLLALSPNRIPKQYGGTK